MRSIAITLAAVSLLVFTGFNALLSTTVHEEGYVPFSPITLLQGARLSHYLDHHAFLFPILGFIPARLARSVAPRSSASRWHRSPWRVIIGT